MKKIIQRIREKFQYDSEEKVLIIRLGKTSLDEAGRYREDAAFWGYATHQRFFKLDLKDIFNSGIYYRQIRGTELIPAPSYDGHLLAMKMKKQFLIRPAMLVTATFTILFILIFLK